MRTTLPALLLAVPLVLAGCAAPKKATAVPPGNEPSIESEQATPDEAAKVTKVGQWARADDGVEFRVARLTKGTVSDTAAGGKPGAPGVIVAVQMRNAGKGRFDMSLVSVSVRVGKDGQEAEQVYQDGVDDSFDGTLAPERTATVRQMYAGRSVADLKTVSVEITPGTEYESFTFEGGI